MRYDYDMLGNRVAPGQHGGRRALDPQRRHRASRVCAWDSRGHRFRTEYDALRRPTRRVPARAAPRAPSVLVGRTVLRRETRRAGPGRATTCAAGCVEPARPGRRRHQRRATTSRATCCARRASSRMTYSATLDWAGDASPLDARDRTTSRTRYDALEPPDPGDRAARHEPGARSTCSSRSYNEANLLEQVDAWLGERRACGTLDAATADLHAVDEHRLRRQGPADARSTTATASARPTPTTADDLRLTHLLTGCDAAPVPDDCPDAAPTGWPGCGVQDLHYTYDPVGNITHIRDDAQQTDLLPQHAGRAERRLHLRRALPADRGDRPRAPRPGRRRAVAALVRRRAARSACCTPATATRWGATSSATSTTPSATSWRCSTAAPTRRSRAGRATYAYDEPSLLEAGRDEQPADAARPRPATRTETYSTDGDGYDATATCCACRTCR